MQWETNVFEGPSSDAPHYSLVPIAIINTNKLRDFLNFLSFISSFEMPPPCPFEVLRFEFTNIQPYSRLKQYKLEAPYVSFNDRLHTTESLKVYQAIVHVMKSLDENAPLEVNNL